MTDHELIELAAKAAGYKLHRSQSAMDGVLLDDQTYWSPLTDDGDALRLAVKLGITMYPAESVGDCATTTFPDGEWVTVESSGDPLADLRRAIVRAAAEIGKAMP
jgi:hypothetical protein